jgi:hypothetical protein
MIRHYIRAFVFAIAVGLASIILIFAIGVARAITKTHTEVCHFSIRHGQIHVSCHEKKRKPRARA